MPERPAAVHAILDGLEADDANRVMQAGSPRSVRQGGAIFRQDEPAVAMYLVETGRVKLTQLTDTGEEVVVRFAGPGDLFAAIAAIDGGSYPFTATAVAPTRLRVWARPALAGLFRAHARFQANVLAVVGAHSREMLDRFRELATEPVAQRVARALMRLRGSASGRPGFVVSGITRRELAEMAGTTVYTVSRLIAGWERRGIVRAERTRLTVVAAEQLEELAVGRKS